jgi:hypothetical protein
MTTSAANLTFGLEIECYIPEANLNFRIGSYHNGIQVPTLPQGWKAERDSSIRPPVGKVAVEFVSPILMGADGVRQVEFVLQWLRDMGAGCNESCGIHVHVGSDEKTAQKLVALVAQHEKALFAACGKKGKVRSNNNIYCRSMIANDRIRNTYETNRNATNRIASDSRYQTLNLTNLMQGTRPAVEFRAFASTFRTEVVLGYIRLCLGLVDWANSSKSAVKFESKVADHASSGKQQMQRLLRRLRWGKATSKDVKRINRGCDFGWLDSNASNDPKAACKALLNLAKEFDAEMAI